MIEAVAYHLPKSQSFRQATKGKPRQAWARIEHMFDTLAADLQAQGNISLSVDSPSEWIDADVADACIDEARRRFGPDAEPGQPTKIWNLAPERLREAIDFALSDDRWPRQKTGPISLFIAYDFNWRGLPAPMPDPASGGQSSACMLLLNFHRRALWVSPRFEFPMTYESAAFREFVARLDAAAPFDIKPHYFRRVLVNPKTGAKRFLKIDAVTEVAPGRQSSDQE